MNRTLSVILSVIAGGIVIALVELVSVNIYPLPEGVDLKDPKQVDAVMHLVPTGALLITLLAWALGSFSAGALARSLAKEVNPGNSLIAGGILMAMALLQLFEFYHPVWFWVAGLAVYMPAAFLGFKMASKEES